MRKYSLDNIKSWIDAAIKSQKGIGVNYWASIAFACIACAMCLFNDQIERWS